MKPTDRIDFASLLVRLRDFLVDERQRSPRLLRCGGDGFSLVWDSLEERRPHVLTVERSWHPARGAWLVDVDSPGQRIFGLTKRITLATRIVGGPGATSKFCCAEAVPAVALAAVDKAMTGHA